MSSRSNGVTKVRLRRSTSSRVTRSPSCSASLISRTRFSSDGNSSRSWTSRRAMPTAFSDARANRTKNSRFCGTRLRRGIAAPSLGAPHVVGVTTLLPEGRRVVAHARDPHSDARTMSRELQLCELHATPTDTHSRIGAMRVGIVDVGANTLRLLVADADREGNVDVVREQKCQLGLGEEIEANGGRIGAGKLAEAAATAGMHVRRARKLNVDAVQILVTSPGRQASNGDELVRALTAATRVPATVLTADAEGELAWRGAVGGPATLPETVGVCDVGGGSVQLVVGTTVDGPAWTRSVDIGSLRLTRRTLHNDPPTAAQLATAEQDVAAAFADLTPPLPHVVYATGGTARALRRIVGRRELASVDLDVALKKLAKRSSRQIANDFGVDRARAHTLTAGTIVISEVQRQLGVPLVVARGGIREGAVLELSSGRLVAAG